MGRAAAVEAGIGMLFNRQALSSAVSACVPLLESDIEGKVVLLTPNALIAFQNSFELAVPNLLKNDCLLSWSLSSV